MYVSNPCARARGILDDVSLKLTAKWPNQIGNRETLSQKAESN